MVIAASELLDHTYGTSYQKILNPPPYLKILSKIRSGVNVNVSCASRSLTAYRIITKL